MSKTVILDHRSIQFQML